ncbi:divergent polysaccharide deacetylase family protein [Candidatus Sodalis endolongispinus]|uniref:Divergent polysaccharide deacetylase family protein n=1 Tax=Candidatus Sodalis endolongispinus TaxID=2812662 RepID=A0ABS5Y9L3_9GAMM|nr:divergent polysaccharide deacetylase family protein [Candidatus Sodalis endolongispinus]MBT9431432.1 divergent polysaccharide deacetylase family protein [Candidatus Sodalis endolongispinus]
MFLLLASHVAQAGKLAIVIDDFGYRPATENQVLAMPVNVSIAVLPDAPYAREMALKAHRQGREILIHLPMAPLSKQPLERNTLTPAMSRDQVADIIRQATQKVPYAVGLNNHMGSAMTSSLSGMQHVTQALSHYSYYFLDSVTIGNSQAVDAAAGTGVRVLKRQVFLDDTANEADIRHQFNRAVALARRNGFAIGHPHPATVRVLQQMLPSLPGDIVLVRPSMLLDERPAAAPMAKPAPPRPHPFRGVPYCPSRQPAPPIYADAMLGAIASSVADTWRNILRGETAPAAGKSDAAQPGSGKPDAAQ